MKTPRKTNALVVGASGGIGAALVDRLAARESTATIFAASRDPVEATSPKVHPLRVDVTKEHSIVDLAANCRSAGPLHHVVIASGVLHSEAFGPEKSWQDLSLITMRAVFDVNTFGPALIAKYCLPLLDHNQRSVFAAISARVGSIQDNRLGGWYSYRASKAALNMLIKTLAIELRRKNRAASCIGLHPGTVDTQLSAPFQRRVPAKQLVEPTVAATQLLDIIDGATAEQSGQVLAWDGSQIPA